MCLFVPWLPPLECELQGDKNPSHLAHWGPVPGIWETCTERLQRVRSLEKQLPGEQGRGSHAGGGEEASGTQLMFSF